jgi:hypothetical protein
VKKRTKRKVISKKGSYICPPNWMKLRFILKPAGINFIKNVLNGLNPGVKTNIS